MTKVANCIECGTLHKGWKRISRVARPLGAQTLGKHAIRSGKRMHGMVIHHDYNYPSFTSNWVPGTHGRQLLNKGGKP